MVFLLRVYTLVGLKSVAVESDAAGRRRKGPMVDQVGAGRDSQEFAHRDVGVFGRPGCRTWRRFRLVHRDDAHLDDDCGAAHEHGAFNRGDLAGG